MTYLRFTLILFIPLFLSVLSCKKKQSDAIPAIAGAEKTIALNSLTDPSATDTLFVKRDKATAVLQIKAKTQAGTDMKRLYIFKRIMDDAMNPGQYTSYMGSGFTQDAQNNYYYVVPDSQADSTVFSITVDLRVNTPAAVMDEFYFVYTDDADFGGPSTTSGIVLGPAQFYIVYGKLTETIGVKIYNKYNNKSYASGLDIVNYIYKVSTDAAADIDLSENTDDNALFIGTFKSLNATTFVKAPASFNYTSTTDTRIAAAFALGTPFSQTPASVAIGDVYLVKLRGTAQYAALRIIYVSTESGTTGPGYDNEFISFAIKK